jgi:two-component system cell cycle sensor histidine kinase/response regulator CckA
MGKALRALLVEDSAADAELLLGELAHAGYDVTAERVQTADTMKAALGQVDWDVVLSDYSMPAFSGPAALAVLQAMDRDIPFIIVSGTIGEETAVTALKAGAHDFLIKGRLARLVPAIERELRDVVARRERRQLEEQLRQAQKMEAIGLLAGGVAHDFNNMLTAILGYAELLIDQIGPDRPMGRDLQEIQNAARRAAALTQQLLAFSRKQVLTVVPVNLNDVVRTLEPMLRRLLGERIAITTTLADDLCRVLADASQLEHLLINLAVNARDAMPQGGTLTIATCNVELDAGHPAPRPGVQAGSYAMVSVTDTGVGMRPEVQARIFEPFFTTKERGYGTGLGLAAVYGTVQQLGGYIGVESQLGSGSTFTINLPKTDQVPKTATARASTSMPVGRETILLVEDERGVRAFTKIALERFGYRVIDADNAEAALALVKDQATPIHLLLTDVVLPGMDGRELAVSLTRDRPEMPVLFMSGYTEDWAGFSSLKQGTHLIEKPFSAQVLLTKIRQLLGTTSPDPLPEAPPAAVQKRS